MFYSLTGKIAHIDENGAAVDCGGVAFYCSASANTLRKIGSKGETATVFTYLNVRGDVVDLFGFHDIYELECFKLLMGVSGVGPKAALSILSSFEPSKLALCIASGDAKSITAAQGIGPKIAQRVVLELKGKLTPSFAGAMSENIEAAGAASAAGSCGEAVSALEMLGYSRTDASVAVGKLDSSLPTEELIKQALRHLARL